MMTSAVPLLAGNAVALAWAPAADALTSRVLRKTSPQFSGADDPAAAIVYEGPDAEAVDITAANGVAYWYKDFGFDGATFAADDAPALTATAGASYVDGAPDARDLVRKRLESGLQQEQARGLLKIKGNGPIAVLSAPPVFESTSWPCVSVHLGGEGPEERGVGETLGIGDDTAEAQEGWLSGYDLDIVAWSQNPDERHLLHKALRRVLLANLAVFDAFGFVLPQYRAKDVDLLQGEFQVPVYTSTFSLNFKAPAFIVKAPASALIQSVDAEAAALVFNGEQE